VSFRSPAEFSVRASSTAADSVKAPSMGFASLFATSTGGVDERASQLPLRSVLGVSHALDGLLRYRPCGFVSPRSHVQGSLFRGFPPGEAVPSRRRPVPSCRWHRSAAARLPVRCHEPKPRLQGLLFTRIRCAAVEGWSPATPDPLLSFSSSRCSVSSSWERLRVPSAHGLYRKTVESSLRLTYSVSPTRSPTLLSRGAPTCPRFPA